jgi:hypothetical protein
MCIGDNSKLLSTIIKFYNNKILNRKKIDSDSKKKDNNNDNKNNLSLDHLNRDKKKTKIWKNIKKSQRLYRYRTNKRLLSFLLISSIFLISVNQIYE